MNPLVWLLRAASNRSIACGLVVCLLLLFSPRISLGQGACCFGLGECAIVDEPTCILELGGEYLGDGVACTPTSCISVEPLLGACCELDGACVQTTLESCLASGGVYFGQGTECTPTLCPGLPPRGACCTAAFGCVVTDPQGCAVLRGRFVGSGTICTDSACDAVGPDSDGDGIPDELDAKPYFFNPGSDPFIPGPNWPPRVAQVDWIATTGEVLQQHSSLGFIGIPVVNTGSRVLWINAEIEGVWHIRNWPVSGVDFPADHPFEYHWTGFVIGPNGVQAELRTIAFTVTADPLDIDLPFPPGAEVFTVPVEQTVQQKGDAGPGPDDDPDRNVPSVPELPQETGTFNVAMPDNTMMQTVTRPNFNFVDLNMPSHRNSCGPAAVASSFAWLNRTYKLGLPDTATKESMLEELERRMQNDPASGTQMSNLLEGKRQFVVKNKLPITIKSQGRGTPNPGAVNPEDLFNEMKRGQDVEIFIRFGGNNHDNQGHYASLVQMKKNGDRYTVTTLDDGQQTAPGGNERRLEGQLVQENGEWFYTDAVGKAKLVGWAAESPTEAKINRAITQCAQDIADALAMPSLTDAQAAAVRKAACLLEFRARALRENALLRMPPASAEELQMINGIIVKATITKMFTILGLGLPPSNPLRGPYLSTARSCASQTLALSNALRDSKPLDSDDDDIPDELDNAPNSANPDQADCNGDGIGDVDQLENNDCNDNGIPDDCDIANGTSQDRNNNGIPDECEPCPCDRDGDGVKTVADYFAYLNEFFSQLGGPGSADLDGDGIVTVSDFFEFLNCLEAISMSEPCP